MKTAYFIILFLILFSISPVKARTRKEGIEQFILDSRESNNGFSDLTSNGVTIASTTLGLEISSKINHDVNNSLDILLYYQNSHNEDGGFGSKPNVSSTWEDTVSAVRGLKHLDLNASHLINWLIFEYMNETASSILYTSIIENNISQSVPNALTMANVQIWRDFIWSSFSFGVFPPTPYEYLITELKAFQRNNGTYNSFEIAVHSILLLTLLNEQPDQVELASKFIRAHAQNNAAFSYKHIGTSSL
ncbi:MAG: hypothetical protein ACXAD7_17675, partial [Candidatus Kariarchaeaceae archaeon]